MDVGCGVNPCPAGGDVGCVLMIYTSSGQFRPVPAHILVASGSRSSGP